MELAKQVHDFENDPVLVLASEEWHHGVIGIVSSRLTEKFNIPSILISVEDGVGKGSGRSIKGFNLFDALNNSSEHLLKYGGHSLAAGLSIEKSKIDMFSKSINEYAKNIITKEMLTPCVYIDDVIEVGDVTLDFVDEFKCLEPFGMGNRTPVFCIEKAKITEKFNPLFFMVTNFRIKKENCYLS